MIWVTIACIAGVAVPQRDRRLARSPKERGEDEDDADQGDRAAEELGASEHHNPPEQTVARPIPDRRR
jgi:hypothetical protein